jgi:predicted RND superfamily exporter protein
MDRLADFLARWNRPLALFVLASAVLPAAYLPRLRIDNSIEVWVRREGEELARYREFLRRFGSDEFIVVALELDEPFSENGLAVQRELAGKLRRVEGVDDVQDLAEIHDILWPGTADWERSARQSPLLKNLLVGSDGKTVGLLVQLEELSGPGSRRRTVREIEAICDRLRESGVIPHLAGTPVMNVALDRAAERASATFMPLAIAGAVVVLGLLLRNPLAVAAVLVAVGTAVLWTVGLLAMSGRTLNMVVVALPTLIFVLGLSGGIHLAWHQALLAASSGSPGEALATTLRHLVRPTIFSGITTAVGFGSLMVAEMAPVSDLGLFAAAGILSSLVCNLTVLPGLLSFASRWRKRGTAPRLLWIGRAGSLAARRPGLFLAAAIFLAALCSLAMTRLHTEADVLSFFPETARVSRDYDFVGRRLTGLYTLELVAHTSASSEPQAVEALRALDRDLASRPEVARTIHIGQLTPALIDTGSGRLAPNPLEAAALLARFSRRFHSVEESGPSRGVFLRFAVLVREMESSKFYGLVNFLGSRAGKRLDGLADWEVTGVVSLLNDAQKALVETQVRSFGMAVAVVLAMTGILFRSLRAIAAAALPNLLPVLATFALMGLADIALDPATVMIASVAIGIAVDDTIHLLGRYRDEKLQGAETLPAVRGALGRAGVPMLFTTVVAAAGFGILCLTDFVPVARFGALTGFTMVAAWAADVLLLPACLRFVRLWEKLSP